MSLSLDSWPIGPCFRAPSDSSNASWRGEGRPSPRLGIRNLTEIVAGQDSSNSGILASPPARALRPATLESSMLWCADRGSALDGHVKGASCRVAVGGDDLGNQGARRSARGLDGTLEALLVLDGDAAIEGVGRGDAGVGLASLLHDDLEGCIRGAGDCGSDQAGLRCAPLPGYWRVSAALTNPVLKQ